MHKRKRKPKNNIANKRKEIYKNVLARITPTQNEIEEEKKIVLEIQKKVLATEGKHSHLEWCGSSARGTHLRGDRDLDLFLMFDKELSEKELEFEGLRIGEIIFKGHEWEKAYSQHPYLRGNIKGFDVEIVPGYIVKNGSEKKSAVDRTPFHNRFLLKKMSKKQRGDARLLKQFLKGINAYGADLKNCALPGYGVELLIVHYKNIEGALKAISKWKYKTKIKISNKKSTAFDSPLTIIDPVDPNRNVASALSREQFERMVFASKLFLEKPSERFFFQEKKNAWPKKLIEEMLSKKELIAFKMNFPKEILSDLVWGQLRRILKQISVNLKENDFVVLRETLWSNEKDVYFIFELESLSLQKSKKIIGPKAEDTENTKKFLNKKRIVISGPRIEGNRIVIEIERQKTSASQVLHDFIKEKGIEEKQPLKTSLLEGVVLGEKRLLWNYRGEFAKWFTSYLEGKEVFE